MNRKKLFILGLLAAAFLGTAVIYSVNNRNVYIGDSTKGSDRYILQFEKMNGADSHVLELSEEDALSVDYRIQHGRVDLSIGSEGEAPIYTGNGIDRGAFDVIIPKDGKYVICVKAKNAEGTIIIQTENREPD